jgi:hypothetical protein
MRSIKAATTALALAGGLALAAAPANAATVHPLTVGCFYTFTADGVYIRANPAGTPITGEGYTGQTFFSYPYASAYANGLYWIQGTDEATGAFGWAALEYLTQNACHNY